MDDDHTPPTEQEGIRERELLMEVFCHMLWQVTLDGGRKRAAGDKPPWWRDDSHWAAIFSHMMRRARGERADPDSGVHPYVHLAWRALAIAYQEMYGKVDPAEQPKLLPR